MTEIYYNRQTKSFWCSCRLCKAAGSQEVDPPLAVRWREVGRQKMIEATQETQQEVRAVCLEVNEMEMEMEKMRQRLSNLEVQYQHVTNSRGCWCKWIVLILTTLITLMLVTLIIPADTWYQVKARLGYVEYDFWSQLKFTLGISKPIPVFFDLKSTVKRLKLPIHYILNFTALYFVNKFFMSAAAERCRRRSSLPLQNLCF